MRRLLILLVFASALPALSSCNIVAPLALFMAPEPMVEPQYVLEDRPTVVFVDDRRNVVTPTSLRRVIAERVSQDLMVQEVLTTTISPVDAVAVARQKDTDESVMSIEEIGRAVGAEQVIYIEMVEFRDRVDRYTPRPQGACAVRVIDVVNKKRLFPADDGSNASHPVQVMMQEMGPEAYQSRATRNQVAELLALRIGEDTAKLFYEYNASKIGKNLDGG